MTDNIVSEERPRSKPRFKKKKKSRAACVIRRILLVLLTVILAVLAALLGVVYVMEKGPSETARNLFVISCRETSAIKWVPNIFLSNEQVELIAAQNAIQETDDITDPGHRPRWRRDRHYRRQRLHVQGQDDGSIRPLQGVRGHFGEIRA